MPKMGKTALYLLVGCSMLCLLLPRALAQQNRTSPPPDSPEQLTLSQSVVCEGIRDFAPQNEAAVFSITLGEIFCYSFFEPIPKETFIYHNWYFRDKLAARIKLTLKPPRWRTYSSIQLRENDKGPWRVEVTGENGHKYRIIRFSITD